MWDWLSQSMRQQLESAGSSHSLIQMAWDMTLDTMPEDELGGVIFDTLCELAPNIGMVITSPRQMVAIKFIEMINTVVALSQAKRSGELWKQIPGIAARHIRYGVESHHANIMGQVLETVMVEALQDEWTEEIAEAWGKHWEDVCNALFTEMAMWQQHSDAACALWRRASRALRRGTRQLRKRLALAVDSAARSCLTQGRRSGAPLARVQAVKARAPRIASRASAHRRR